MGSFLGHSDLAFSRVIEGTKAITTPYIATYEETIENPEHDYVCDNQYIREGYRINYHSMEINTRSCCESHNETGNIWTHLIGLLLFLYYLGLAGTVNYTDYRVQSYANTYSESIKNKTINNFFITTGVNTENSNNNNSTLTNMRSPSNSEALLIKDLSTVGIQIQCIGCIFCLLLSTLYHTYKPINRATYVVLRRLDFSGIVCCIIGTAISAYYYYFFCNDLYRNLYCYTIGISGVLVLVFSALGSKKYDKLKMRLMIAQIVISFAPRLHTLLFLDEELGMIKDPIEYQYYIGSFVILLGFIIFSKKIPERFSPGRFDYILNSHQIWHVFVILGMHYLNNGVYDFYFNRMVHRCPS